MVRPLTERCPLCGETIVAIGHGAKGVYDGVCFWSCPKCEKAWHRFPPGDRRRERLDAWAMSEGVVIHDREAQG